MIVVWIALGVTGRYISSGTLYFLFSMLGSVLIAIRHMQQLQQSQQQGVELRDLRILDPGRNKVDGMIAADLGAKSTISLPDGTVHVVHLEQPLATLERKVRKMGPVPADKAKQWLLDDSGDEQPLSSFETKLRKLDRSFTAEFTSEDAEFLAQRQSVQLVYSALCAILESYADTISGAFENCVPLPTISPTAPGTPPPVAAILANPPAIPSSAAFISSPDGAAGAILLTPAGLPSLPTAIPSLPIPSLPPTLPSPPAAAHSPKKASHSTSRTCPSCAAAVDEQFSFCLRCLTTL